VEVTFKAVGPDVGDVVGKQVKALTAANRKVGNAVKKAGVQAIRANTPKHFGTNRKTGARYPLSVKGKILSAGGDHVEVRLYGTPVGFWAILNDGRTGGYFVRPRYKKALSWNGQTAASKGHEIKRGVAGTHAWSHAEAPMKAALKPAISDEYDVVFSHG
jgi:hypothetical protein